MRGEYEKKRQKILSKRIKIMRVHVHYNGKLGTVLQYKAVAPCYMFDSSSSGLLK